MKKILTFAVFLGFVLFPLAGHAQGEIGQETVFDIEPSYDAQNRDEISATLVMMGPKIYWYLETSLWEEFSEQEKQEMESSLTELIKEFEDNIYPQLTQTFGSEWTPGIDKDTRITVLFHQMEKGAGGYIDTADEYPKVQIPESNEREMVYLNASFINDSLAKSLLAHEFMHLITFNQKEKNHGVSEETWLNEARADYAPTFLGYDEVYKGSNLQRRVNDFLENPFDSLTEWKDRQIDYSVANLFVQYLVDHYGIRILVDSLKMEETGIESLNSALDKSGFSKDFDDVFIDWAITVLINNCQVSQDYCYTSENLDDFRINPLVNYLPLIGESTLSVNNTTKDWAGNWHKFVGGSGILKLEFQTTGGKEFVVPYILERIDGSLEIDRLIFNGKDRDQILVSGFGKEYISLTIVPITMNKTSGFSSIEPSHSFFWSASTEEEQQQEVEIPYLPPLQKPVSQLSRAELSQRIDQIKAVILQLQQLLAQLGEHSCSLIDQDLYFGIEDSSRVRCLQEFLKSQGSEIYPEGLVTGNFFTLTEKAVIRFQEKYASEILEPLGLQKSTGYVGSSTREKINELLGG